MRYATHQTDFVILLLIASLFGGCFYANFSHSSGSQSIGSRKVQYDVDGPGDTSTDGDVISLKFEGGDIDVEKSRLLLNGQEIATFPEETKVVFVKYASGKLSVTADGATVYPAMLAEEPAPATE